MRGEESIGLSASQLSSAALASRLPLRLASLVSFLSLGGSASILVIGSPAKACRLPIVLLPIGLIVVIVIVLGS